jgi:hypothetical protein
MRDAGKSISDEHLPTPVQKQNDNALAFCDGLIQDFKARADRHKQLFKRLNYSSVSLGILVTVVSALTAIQGAYLWVVPIISGLSALCTALLSATNSQERWTYSRGVQQQLETEQFLYLQRAGRYATSDEEANVRLFSERLADIWSEGHQLWDQTVSKGTYEPPSKK